MTVTEPRVEAPAQPPPEVSERTRYERRLGLALSAPAFIVMVFVTAYPLIYAVVLAFYDYRLTDPGGRTFVGLSNFATVLTDPVWWSDFTTTLIITVVSVGVELVLGFAFAMVMYKILFGRGLVRTGILVPVRHHHGRVGVHLALCVPARLGIREPVVRPRRFQLVR